jgi:uncharacterized protein (DUF427 family)
MENVYDYPRPPAVEPCGRRARVIHGGVTVADSMRALRVLETTHPPAIYIPPDDVAPGLLKPSAARQTVCEWKGRATYWDLDAGGSVVRAVAWSYASPVAAYAMLRDHLAFYPGRVDQCLLDDEVVAPQPSDFYGGWITAEISLARSG